MDFNLHQERNQIIASRQEALKVLLCISSNDGRRTIQDEILSPLNKRLVTINKKLGL